MAIKKLHVASGDAAKLDDILCFAIYSANLTVNQLYKPLLDELGLTYPQYLVLVALYEQDNQTVGNLGDKLFLKLEYVNSSAQANGRRGLSDTSARPGG